MGVAVLTDTVACLSPETRPRLGIGMVGICIILEAVVGQKGTMVLDQGAPACLGSEIDERGGATPGTGRM